MKSILCTVAALMVASAAFAGSGEMTPQQAMEKMMNCPVCSVWNTEPTLGPTMRYSITPTKTGYVESLVTADESMKPAFDKCAAECEKRAAGIPSMSDEDKGKLCAFCIGQVKLMGNKDVTVEHVSTPMGLVMVATATTPAGVQAAHEYAANAKKQSDLMQQAAHEMHGKKEVMKGKM